MERVPQEAGRAQVHHANWTPMEERGKEGCVEASKMAMQFEKFATTSGESLDHGSRCPTSPRIQPA